MKKSLIEANDEKEKYISSEYWDKWWINKYKEGKLSHYITPSCRLLYCYQDKFINRGVRKILFAANGISQEPREFAYAGFEVLAMDISPVATKIASSLDINIENLSLEFYQTEKGQRVLLETWSPKFREGGSIKFITGNVNDLGTSLEIFDVIICKLLLQYYDGQYLSSLCQNLIDSLSSGGFLLVHIGYDHDSKSKIESALQMAGGVAINGHNEISDMERKYFLIWIGAS